MTPLLPFLPSSPLQQVVANQYFEYTMLVLILMSSLELCFDDATVEPGSTKAKVLHAMDIFFTIAFGMEVSRELV